MSKRFETLYINHRKLYGRVSSCTEELEDWNYSYRGILVRLVMCVMVGHRKLKIEIIKLLTILC